MPVAILAVSSLHMIPTLEAVGIEFVTTAAGSAFSSEFRFLIRDDRLPSACADGGLKLVDVWVKSGRVADRVAHEFQEYRIRETLDCIWTGCRFLYGVAERAGSL